MQENRRLVTFSQEDSTGSPGIPRSTGQLCLEGSMVWAAQTLLSHILSSELSSHPGLGQA